MQVSHLVLEVTRKCQLKCPHCLRGDAQRMTMSREILLRIFQDVDEICSLTLTGGEPSLVPEVLEMIMENLYWHHTSIGSFYIVSNGMNHNRYRRFLNAVERLYEWCDEKDICVLTVSRDQYHPFDAHKHLSKFERSYGEFPEYFHDKDRYRNIYRLLNEGRAKENQLGDPAEVEYQEPWQWNEDYVVDPLVYVSANGSVVSGCNMSFDRIDAESKGNILETPLTQIIESYCTKEVQEEKVA